MNQSIRKIDCCLTMLAVLVVVTALTDQPLAGQTTGTPDSSLVRVDGLVLEQQKYSFTMRGMDRDYRVMVPNGTPLLMKLTNPQLDFQQHQLTVELLVSAPDGQPANNLRLDYPLPDPVYLSADADDSAARDGRLDMGVRQLDRFVLSSRALPPGERAVQGKLLPSQLPGQFKLEDDTRVTPVRLGTRKGLLANSSIMQLRPHETDVIVEGRFDGDSLIASRIRFQHIGDPFARFDPDLPNALILGDLISINYDRALRAALAGTMNVHHPPCTCGGSRNWRSLHRWIANPDREQRRWDVIAFNFGLQDKSTSRANWTSNLRRAIEILEQTGARLVWVTATPIPRGFPPASGNQPLGMVQGRMQLQNQWAAEVLQDYPHIDICDLWEVVDRNPDGVFDQWWTGNDPTFNHQTSIPLGQRVAESLLQTVGTDSQ